jgi:ribonuclease-3 family protein
MDYLEATGFEAVLGYLYLTGDMDRICELVTRGVEAVELDIL